jgi:hypothetical protein
VCITYIIKFKIKIKIKKEEKCLAVDGIDVVLRVIQIDFIFLLFVCLINVAKILENCLFFVFLGFLSLFFFFVFRLMFPSLFSFAFYAFCFYKK